jgi:DNA polymerase I-like protein with 3'-5' exonuclease and polymerase domains
MIEQKKSELVDDLFKSGVGFEAMPLHDVVIPYAEADVRSCGGVYLSQMDAFEAEENVSLKPIIVLMNEMLEFLVECETNGVKIDLEELSSIGEQFQKEHDELSKRLEEIVEIVMGDTPINLNSGADVSKLIYSREVVNRDYHIQTFRIGTNAEGKPLPPPRMNKAEFNTAVRSNTRVVQKTSVVCCPECDGRGLVQKYKQKTRTKNKVTYKVPGDPYKNLSKCPSCVGVGAFYNPTGKVAGLKISPLGPQYASVNGFKTDKGTIKLLISHARSKNNDLAVEFLTKISRLSAVSTYLTSFVKGIETWTRPNGLIHTNFNQCITATGRLSSSNINLQNMPKRGFPVRKAMVSRFDYKIVEFDYSGLEFRVAGEVSRDPQIIEDILNGKDIHKQTASIIHRIPAEEVTKETRAQIKFHTFAPLYGSQGSGLAEHEKKYYDEFFVIYKGLKSYQQRLMDGVVKNGIVQTPSGRQYYWPNARRLKNGRVTNATQVVNYPIQGFATGDIVPLACIRAFRLFKKHNLKSKLILTVHDSIVVDCHPDELTQVKKVLVEAMANVGEELEQRFDYKPVLPLDVEMTVGPNWLEQEEIPLD